MNNNFKKLLASAMALAMVTSVMPATNVDAAIIGSTSCSATAQNLYKEMKYLFEEADLERTDFINDEIINSTIGKTVVDYFSDETYGTLRLNALKEIAGTDGWSCAADTETKEKAQYILDAYEAIYELLEKTDLGSDPRGVLPVVEDRLNNKTYSIDSLEKEGNYSAFLEARSHLAFLEAFEKFENNVDNAVYNRVEEAVSNLQYVLDKARPDWEFGEEKKLVLAMESVFKSFVKYETESGNKKDNSITKNEVTLMIRSIEKGKAYNTSVGTEEEWNTIRSLYPLYKNNADVVEFMDSLKEMYDEIDAARELISRTKNETYAEFLKVARDYKNAKEVNAELTMDDYKVFKEFKEEVIDKVVTLTVKEYSKFYALNAEKSLYITTAELERVLADFVGSSVNPYTELLAFDEKEGTIAWDLIAEHMEEVIKNYNALTKGIDGLDAVSIVASDKEDIKAADDALFFFEDEADDKHTHLTKSEKKEVRDNERKVVELYEAYRNKFGSLTGATGWVDMGNGNWKYYEEDGTAPTKWICTAKDTWYYVSNGVMLRNAWVWRDSESAYYVGNDGKMVYGPTTVNGYELDANGLWHK